MRDDARVFISLDHHDGSFLQNPSLADLVVLDRKFKLKKALTYISGSEDQTKNKLFRLCLARKLADVKRCLKNFSRYSDYSLEVYLRSSLSLNPSDLKELLVKTNPQNYVDHSHSSVSISSTPTPTLSPFPSPPNPPIFCVVGAIVGIQFKCTLATIFLTIHSLSQHRIHYDWLKKKN